MVACLLASVPLIPQLLSRSPSGEAPYFYIARGMVLIGLPLMLLFYSGRCGSQATESSALNTEQLLPVSQYKLLLSCLIALLIQTGLLLVILYIIVTLTAAPANKKEAFFYLIQDFPYYLVLLQVVLTGFAFAYALRNAIAGGVLAGIAFICAGIPWAYMHDYNLAYSISDRSLLAYLVTICASISAIAVVKLLSGISDRKEKKSILNLSLITILLIAGPFVSYASFIAFNLAARSRIVPIGPYYRKAPAGINIPAADIKAGYYSALALRMKPYSGEIFFIDKTGKHVLIAENPEDSGRSCFTPVSHNRIEQVVMNQDGEIWLLWLNRLKMRHEVLHGSKKNGLELYAVVDQGWGIWLVGGIKPVILKRERNQSGANQYYRCELPGKGIVDCKKDSTPAPL
jgi:hypothetical protein